MVYFYQDTGNKHHTTHTKIYSNIFVGRQGINKSPHALLIADVASRQEMLTPRAPDLTFFRGFTYVMACTYLPILTLSPGFYD